MSSTSFSVSRDYTNSLSLPSFSRSSAQQPRDSIESRDKSSSSRSEKSGTTATTTTTAAAVVVVPSESETSTSYDPAKIDKAILILQGSRPVSGYKEREFERLQQDLITFLQYFQVPDNKKHLNLNAHSRKNILSLREDVKQLLEHKGFQKSNFATIIKGFDTLVKGIAIDGPGYEQQPWSLHGSGRSGEKSERKKSSLKRIMRHAGLDGESSSKERVKKVSAKIFAKQGSKKDKAKLEDAIYDTYKDTIRIFWKRPEIGYKLHPKLFKRYHKVAEEYLTPLDMYDPPKKEYPLESGENPYTKAHRPLLLDDFSDYKVAEKKAIINFLFMVQNRKKNPRSAKQKEFDKKLGAEAKKRSGSKNKKKKKSVDSKSKKESSIHKLQSLIKKLKQGSSDVEKSTLRGYFIYGKRYGVISKNTTIRDFINNPTSYLSGILAYMEKNRSSLSPPHDQATKKKSVGGGISRPRAAGPPSESPDSDSEGSQTEEDTTETLMTVSTLDSAPKGGGKKSKSKKSKSGKKSDSTTSSKSTQKSDSTTSSKGKKKSQSYKKSKSAKGGPKKGKKSLEKNHISKSKSAKKKGKATSKTK